MTGAEFVEEDESGRDAKYDLIILAAMGVNVRLSYARAGACHFQHSDASFVIGMRTVSNTRR